MSFPHLDHAAPNALEEKPETNFDQVVRGPGNSLLKGNRRPQIGTIRNANGQAAGNGLRQQGQCHTLLDLGLIYDFSGSIAVGDVPTIVNFLSQLVTYFPVNPNESRIGLVGFLDFYVYQWDKYGNYARDYYSNLSSIDAAWTSGHPLWMNAEVTAQAAIDSLAGANPNSGTPLGEALYAYNVNYFISTQDVGNPGAVVLLTDGEASPGTIDATTQANNLRAKGVTVYCVGVGAGINSTELTNIAGDASRVVLVSDFSLLAAAVYTVAELACPSWG